jgi:hypothetical protein
MKENLNKFLEELAELSNEYGLILESDPDGGIEVLTKERRLIADGVDYDTQLQKYTTLEERYEDEIPCEDDSELSEVISIFNQASLVTLKTLQTSNDNAEVIWKPMGIRKINEI